MASGTSSVPTLTRLVYSPRLCPATKDGSDLEARAQMLFAQNQIKIVVGVPVVPLMTDRSYFSYSKGTWYTLHTDPATEEPMVIHSLWLDGHVTSIEETTGDDVRKRWYTGK